MMWGIPVCACGLGECMEHGLHVITVQDSLKTKKCRQVFINVIFIASIVIHLSSLTALSWSGWIQSLSQGYRTGYEVGIYSVCQFITEQHTHTHENPEGKQPGHVEKMHKNTIKTVTWDHNRFRAVSVEFYMLSMCIKQSNSIYLGFIIAKSSKMRISRICITLSRFSRLTSTPPFIWISLISTVKSYIQRVSQISNCTVKLRTVPEAKPYLAIFNFFPLHFLHYYVILSFNKL